jgi:hypothetical protein
MNKLTTSARRYSGEENLDDLGNSLTGDLGI